MRRIKGTTRILILVLLILRVLAAPVSARPYSYGPHPKAGFVIRHCKWPAQRPQRATASAISVPLNPGLGDTGLPQGVWSKITLAHTSPILSCIFHLVAWTCYDSYAPHLVDRLRC